MNNNFKKFFLLPSLLLTQAYCLEQCVNVNNNTNIEKYSEKIKINLENSSIETTILNEKLVDPKQEKISTIETLLLSLATATLAVLFLKYKIKINFDRKINLFEKLIIIVLKVMKKTFLLIKSIKKTFHSIYKKLYFSLSIPQIN
jgi:hypothetical protein